MTSVAFRCALFALTAFLPLFGLSGIGRAEPPMPAEQRQAIEQVVRDYLLAHPEILIEMSDALEKRQKAKATTDAVSRIMENRTALFRSTRDYVLNQDGGVPVVEFFDYNCGYCKRSIPQVLDLQKTDTRVRFVFKEFPILGEGSVETAKAAIAAKNQGRYLDYHNALMAYRGHMDGEAALAVAASVGLDVARLKRDMEDPSVEREIQANHELAERLNIRGTPTFIVGERLVPGAIDRQALGELVGEAATNCRVC